MPDEILSRLKDALAAAGVEPELLAGLTPATSLSDDLGVDSFQLTRMATHLEEAYDSRFTLVDWVLAEEAQGEAPYTVGSLLVFVRARLNPEEDPRAIAAD